MAKAIAIGGYDYDFVNKVSERLTCQICAKPFRDPHLVVCCGKHYCGSCLTDWFRKHSGSSRESCPHCRAKGKKFSHVIHKGLKSEVGELKIYCPKRDKGCKWVGQLGNLEGHRTSENGCDYERIPCPNMCKDSVVSKGIMLPLSTNKHILRKDLTDHLANECINRSYSCKYCGKTDTYEIIEFHYRQCLEYPVPCPNVRCQVSNIKRKDLDDHRKKCPEELVECPFAEAGCKERVRRCQFDDHMTSNIQNHLVTLMGAYKDVKRRLEELEGKPKAKRAKLSGSYMY